MELKLLKCDWGMEHLGDMPARLEAYAAAGYDGVECSRLAWTQIASASSSSFTILIMWP